MADMQPGQIIIPHDPNSNSDGSPEPERNPEPGEPEQTPTPAPMPESATLSTPAVEVTHSPWQYNQENGSDGQSYAPLPENIRWTASEFIEHSKSIAWYAKLVATGLIAVALVYLVTRDKITTGVIVFALTVFGVYAARKPSTQEYTLDAAGLQIGTKFYDLQDFKTFSITDDGAIPSIVFMPLKRFMPPLTIYVAPDMEEQVVDFLSAFLPVVQHKADAVDSLLRRIHF